MMKRFTFTLLFLCIVSLCAVHAQSYNKLWKQAIAAHEDDLPRTAISVVTRIQQKAEKEGNTSQLIRALTTRVMLGDDISMDTAAVTINQMREYLQAETRPVERALWNVAMAKTLDRFAWRDTSSRSLSTRCYEDMMSDINALGNASTKDYMPLFVKGKNSAYFNHDVLHVLAFECMNEYYGHRAGFTKDDLISRLLTFYRSKGNRNAVLFLTLDSLDRKTPHSYDLLKNEGFSQMRQLAREYRDLPLNVQTYVTMTEQGYRSRTNDSLLSVIAEEGIRLYGTKGHGVELRNYLERVNQPVLHISGLPNVVYPGMGYDARLSFKAKHACEVRVYRLDNVTAQQLAEDRSNMEDFNKTLVLSYPYSVREEPPYVQRDTTVRFVAPEQPGIYIVRIFDGEKEHGEYYMHCTRLKHMLFTLEEGKNRVSIVDALSGKPIKGTSMQLCTSPSERRNPIEETIAPDADGNYFIDVKKKDNRTAYVTYGEDCALPSFQLERNYKYNENKIHSTSVRLYTDRGIYRPGQKVIVGGFMFTQNEDSLYAEPESSVSVSLYDSNYKLVSKQQYETDELGNFGGEFQLPQTVLPGRFRLHAECSGGDYSMYIDVQEYKRPTYTVEIDPLTRTYQPGDTLLITGTARTYSGLPVEGAEVKYETQCYELFYWFRRGDEASKFVQRGDTVTDADGRFCIPVVLAADGEKRSRVYYRTNIDVVAQHGETQSATQQTYVSYNRAYLSVEFPEIYCFERPKTIIPYLFNAQGNEIDAKGILRVELGKNKIFTDSIRSGQPLRLTRDRFPASGSYWVQVVLEKDGETYKDSRTIRFFSETDTRPVANDDFWYNVRMSEQSDTAYVIIGSAKKDVTMFYDVYTGEEIVENRLVNYSDSLLHYTLCWKPEYGDAAKVAFAFVKDSKLYSKVVTLIKPKPDKTLKVGWVTFRSLLTPGQQEEWRLRVTLPDGTPARAAMMARLYDASIDALKPYNWHLGFNFPRYVPYCSWGEKYVSRNTVSGYYPLDLKEVPDWEFTVLTPMLFLDNDRPSKNRRLLGAGGVVYENDRMVMMASEPMMARNAGMVTADGYEAAEENSEDESGSDAAAVVPRTNFSETAFFYPTLHTEQDGSVSIAFTLPESLTQWNFRALAHTADMRYALIDTSAVARKEFMVEPAMPRFVREGDKAQIPVTVRNLTDNALSGNLLLQALDPVTEKVILKQNLKFAAPANGSEVQTFEIDADKLGGAGVVTIRITGKSGLFGDGEEHYLPVLTSREQVISTLPFSLTDHHAQTLRVDTMWSKSSRMADRQLTVEATSNPVWYAVTALPVMADRACYSSDDWAHRLYAVILARHIAKENPSIMKAYGDTALTEWAGVLQRNEDLKNTIAEETPWLNEGESEAARAAALAKLFDEEQNALKEHTALNQLRKLQNADGSWSWCPGMSGSEYMTSRIAVILARLQKLTGYKSNMLSKAYGFLENGLVEYVKVAKKKKYKGCPYVYLNYLYAASLTNRVSDKKGVKDAVKFLLEQVEEDVKSEDMHTKSLCAVVLSQYGKDAAAHTVLQSLIEHTTIGDPQRGRFFDTRRAPMTWSSYRIPTQTSTMEALTMTAPDVMWNAEGKLVGVRDKVLAEMRIWLLQAKRTQMWETSSASIDAIYALLLENGTTPSSDLIRETTPVRYTLQNKAGKIITVNRREDVKGAETAGYICDRYAEKPQLDAHSVTVRGYDNTISWGSIYTRYTLPVEDVVAGGKGLTLTRSIEVYREGNWQAVNNAQTPLATGDRLRVVFTIKADRDYDYVSLRSGRAACTEPVDKLSGYRWNSAGGCYRVVRDTDLQYFFEKMPKGTHTFAEELLIDRAGVYTFAPSRVQSLYSPEFQAISTASTLTVKP